MVKKKIRLIKVSEEDSKVLWEWRNHPEVRKYFFCSHPIAWEDHQAWFSKKLKDDKTWIYIALLGKDKVGVIRFEDNGENILVSVNLNPDYFGRGIGSAIIKLGTMRLLKQDKVTKPIIANIKLDNVASHKAFLKVGYKVIKKTKRELIYEYNC